ncbi:MAG: helix-turn-helix transcriptional regulator [Defluviitaleaceae bacterium]|nr:helix-turn-helix transcriptional regulator [Defluviitaleaceae bacterium]MCL2200163.1 helix-turn-helix transcriptional regulator [Defluviitaleaceae bacterium]
MIDNIGVGNQILLLRKRNGFTQEELAEKLKISAQAISKWENGHTLPETALLPLLAKFLNTSIDSILMPNTVKEGDIINLGNHQWKVLHVNVDSAFIISETTIGKAPYDDRESTTWENCSLRKYLNGEFYDTFNHTDKSRIIKTKLTDRNNPWYGTKYGNSTFDKIFLLSYDEVIRHFGDSGDMQNKKGWYWGEDGITPNDGRHLPYGDCIYDQFNDERKAQNTKGEDDWWWLRSPGHAEKAAGSIGYCGELFLCGDDICRIDGGVRPALWVTI